MSRAPSGGLLFLTGWPACGPSHYGEWLSARCDFRHLDLDSPPHASESGRAAWVQHMPGNAPALAAELRKSHPRWVLTAENPVAFLPCLKGLLAAGFSPWFLQPLAESVSRISWLQHERELDPEVRPVVWDRQAAAIRSSARELRPYFRDRCLTTLRNAGELMDAIEFAAQIGVPAAT